MRYILLCLLFFASVAGKGQGIENPVLPGVADAGVMKYNGRYYIGGVFTKGDFYVSDDLVHWDGPFHAVTMNNDWATPYGVGDEQIHANDLHYLNGVFHLYWSVNHWGSDRNIVHIAHAVSDKPLGPYYEPDKSQWLDNRIDAHLFQDDDGKLYFYMVKFTDGNAIWARRMKDPATFDGEAELMFASQPTSWETLDNRVAEGPWVIHYRDRYYMMYNANHTATSYGNYALGVAEASSPLGFNNGGKYPHPVVRSNQIELEDNYVKLLDYKSVDDGILQKNFVYDKAIHGNLSLRVKNSGSIKATLNGSLIYESDRPDFRHIDLQAHQNLLKAGENSLTFETSRGRRGAVADIALFAMRGEKAGDILYTPGQPNILRGPNGFEWWLIYMANKNGEPRGQYIDRVLFQGSTLTVDGITSSATAGYHPAPSLPTYRYLTNSGQARPALNQPINSTPAENYYFEANIKGQNETGIIAWQSGNQSLTITLNADAKQWSYTLTDNGKKEHKTYPLPQDFKADVYHSIAVFKNHNIFNVLIDNIPAPQMPVIETPFAGKGLPGILSSAQNVEIDGITYTIGWDEYGENIRGWTKNGDVLLKGDMLENYEFSLTIKNNGRKSRIYPVYIDAKNYLSAEYDFANHKLTFSGKNRGNEIEKHETDLSEWQECYVNNVFSDMMERHFKFGGETVAFDGLLLPKKAVFQKDTLIENIEEKFDFYYLKDGRRHAIPVVIRAECGHPDFVRIAFDSIEADELILAAKGTENSSLQKIRIRLLEKQNYSFRAVKNSEKIRIFAGSKQVMEIPDVFGASRVGISADAQVDYIMLYDSGK